MQGSARHEQTGGKVILRSRKGLWWLTIGLGLPLVWIGFRWAFRGPLENLSPWLAVPALFVAFQWLADTMLSLTLGKPGLLSPAEAGQKTVLFLLLGLLAVPLLLWGGLFAGSKISPLWPAAAAYFTYTFWEPVG